MTTSVTLAYGSVSFSAESENEVWISAQLDKVLGAAEILSQHPTNAQANSKSSSQGDGGEPLNVTLATYLKSQNADSNQVRRFLATADWLRRKGHDKINTAMVSKALSDNQQKRLGNPADSLNKNVAKGHCEKNGDEFFITPEGLKTLGHE
jgi:hypothetical protein